MYVVKKVHPVFGGSLEIEQHLMRLFYQLQHV